MDLIRVNGNALTMQEAVRRDMLHDNTLLKNAIEEMVLRQYAQDKGIANTDEELQVALDEMRYQRGLESAESTNQWLNQNNQTTESVVNGLDYQILRNKIRHSIPESDRKAYFTEHKLDFDRVVIRSIRVGSKDVAEELKEQVEEGEDFSALAREHSEDDSTSAMGGYVGAMGRSDVTAEIEAAIFGADEGDVVGPVETEKGWNLFLVEKKHKASYDEMEDYIQLALFDELAAKLKAEAKIEYPVFA